MKKLFYSTPRNHDVTMWYDNETQTFAGSNDTESFSFTIQEIDAIEHQDSLVTIKLTNDQTVSFFVRDSDEAARLIKKFDEPHKYV